MKITILGYSGKIGVNLVKALQKTNHRIFIVTRKKNIKISGIDFIYCDLNKEKNKLDQKIKDSDIIINLIGEYQNEKRMYQTNVTLLKNLIYQINHSKLKKKLHFVHLSSCSVYGYYFNSRKLNEYCRLEPNNLYGKTKLLAEEIVIKNSNKFFSYTIIRPSGVIDDKYQSSGFLKLINLAKKRFTILFGKKDAIGNFIHIDDLVELIITVSHKKMAKNKVYNISHNFSYNQIFDVIDKNLSYRTKRIYFYSKILLFIYLKIRSTIIRKVKLPDIRFLLYKTEYDSSLVKKELNFRFKKNIKKFVVDNTLDK